MISDARIVLGGSVQGFKGCMPGVAEEALLAVGKHQPLFVLGGFGGCARDIAAELGLVRLEGQSIKWKGREQFSGMDGETLANGLNPVENKRLADTPHIDEAAILILRGLMRLVHRRLN